MEGITEVTGLILKCMPSYITVLLKRNDSLISSIVACVVTFSFTKSIKEYLQINFFGDKLFDYSSNKLG